MTPRIHPAKSNVRPISPETLRRFFGDTDPAEIPRLDLDLIELSPTRYAELFPRPQPAERMVNYFRHNGDRIVFGIVCFALGSLATDATIYVWTVFK